MTKKPKKPKNVGYAYNCPRPKCKYHARSAQDCPVHLVPLVATEVIDPNKH